MISSVFCSIVGPLSSDSLCAGVDVIRVMVSSSSLYSPRLFFCTLFAGGNTCNDYFVFTGLTETQFFCRLFHV
jgi:hypothetical protein